MGTRRIERQRSNSPISIRCLHLHPVMGQSQQKMKLFEPTPTKQPLFIDLSNINDENKPSAFQNFIGSVKTKSWLAAGGVISITPKKKKPSHEFSGSPTSASPGFGR